MRAFVANISIENVFSTPRCGFFGIMSLYVH
jgi:hypothetical protein